MSHISIPFVIEQNVRGERSYDLFSRLLKDRIIFLGTPIDADVANIIIGQILFLESEDPNKDIILYINSPGGEINAGLGIYDCLSYVSCPVSTICIGQAASMAAILLAAGSPKKRFALPNSRIMCHQPSGGCGGVASDIEIQTAEILRLKQRLNEILAKHTGQTVQQVEKDTARDNYMSAEQARSYGIVDAILEKRPAPKVRS